SGPRCARSSRAGRRHLGWLRLKREAEWWRRPVFVVERWFGIGLGGCQQLCKQLRWKLEWQFERRRRLGDVPAELRAGRPRDDRLPRREWQRRLLREPGGAARDI